MTIIDRYIIRQFLLNLAILFTVLVGLYVLMDLIINFDEFIQLSQRWEGTGWGRVGQTILAVYDYYLPQTLLLYVYMVGLLPVAAAGFTLANFIRNREIVAMLAGGISMYRIATPILVMGFATNVLLVVDQEFILPHLAYKLSRSPASLKNEQKQLGPSLRFFPDGKGALFTAKRFNTRDLTMHELTILRRQTAGESYFGRASERIQADSASWDAVNQGWNLVNGRGVRRDLADGSQPAPAGTPRSAPAAPASPTGFFSQEEYEVKFVPSDLDPLTILMRERSRYSQLVSMQQLGQLIDRAQAARTLDVADLIRIRHMRFSMLVVNMLILAVGLPYFLLRAPAPLLLASIKACAITIGAWAGGMIMMQMGPDLLPPAAVAWLPVAMYLPLAWYRMETIET